ncbi:hypothetical protein SAMN06269185_3328, partial [Natronoarchaeum philippinense]
KSQRDRRKRVLAILDDQDGVSMEELVEITDSSENKLEQDVQALMDRGQVYEQNGELRMA